MTELSSPNWRKGSTFEKSQNEIGQFLFGDVIRFLEFFHPAFGFLR